MRTTHGSSRIIQKRMPRQANQFISALVLAASCLSACGADQSSQWLETAQLEERQNNVAHAKQLYEDILRLYPNSPAAEVARTRLDQLNRRQ